VPEATAVQEKCDRCGAPLQPNAIYCDRCGQRTRLAERRVRVAIRLELVFIVLVVAMIVAFTWVQYYSQR
jgi:uncharacterized OB-fold protein